MRSWLVAFVALLCAGCVDAKATTSAPKKGHVIAYTASWCAPCQREKPQIDEIRRAGVTVKTVDCSDHAPPHIRSLPTYEVIDSSGKKVSTHHTAKDLRATLRRLRWIR